MLLSTHGYSSAPNNIASDTFKKNLLFTHIPTPEFKKAYNEYKKEMEQVINTSVEYHKISDVEVGSFYAHFLKSFNHKWVLNFVKGFFCIC